MKRPPLWLLAFSLSALFAGAPDAAARNVFKEFSKAPTFTPPAGCVPREQTYGVLSRCEMTIAPGHTFVAFIDTAMGLAATTEFFVTDQVKDFKSYWQHDYPGKNLAFSSRVSTIVPGGNRPSHGTNCIEYSIAELDNATGNPPVQTLWRVDGLTCAWLVDNPKPGKMTIEQFWLEVYDGYDPAKGQKPMESFDSIVRELFASVRL
jgi:hypothetical protein